MWDYAAWLPFHTWYSERFNSLTPCCNTNSYLNVAAWLHSFTQDTWRLTPFFHKIYFVRTCSWIFFPQILQLDYIFFNTKYSLISSVWLLFLTQDTLWDFTAWPHFVTQKLCDSYSFTSVFHTRYYVRSNCLTAYFTQDTQWDLTAWHHFRTPITMWNFQLVSFLLHKILCEILQFDSFLSHKIIYKILLLDSFFYTRYFVRSWSLTPFFTKDILWELAAFLMYVTP